MAAEPKIISPGAAQSGLWLYFNKGKKPQLLQAFYRFQPDDILGDLKYGSRDKNGFRWDKSIKAFCLLCVHYVIHSKNSDYEFADGPHSQKQRPDAAESLNDAFGHRKGWHLQLFKSKKSNIKARLFRGLNSKGNSEKPQTRIFIDRDLMPPALIQIFRGNEKLSAETEPELLWGLLDELKAESADFRSLRGLPPDPFHQNKNPNPKTSRQKLESDVCAKPPPQRINEIQKRIEKSESRIPNDATQETQQDRHDKPKIDLAGFYALVDGKPPCVDKDIVRQFRGEIIKPYLHVTQPDTNPPPQYQQDEWLDADCAVVLANLLAKEPLKILLGIFQDDEFALRVWAKEKVAAALWQNLELQEDLPRSIATSTPRLKQIWQQECVRFFPTDAQAQTSKLLSQSNLKTDGSTRSD